MKARTKAVFDEATCTISYVVAEPEGRHCAVIESVLNFDLKSGRTATTTADQVVACVEKNSLTVDWILETHGHADHVTAAPNLLLPSVQVNMRAGHLPPPEANGISYLKVPVNAL